MSIPLKVLLLLLTAVRAVGLNRKLWCMNEIIIVGTLEGGAYAKRQKHCKRVLSTDGICVCIPAGCGMGGGITPKIVVYE